MDNGQTVQIYTGPFTISTPGETIIQFKSIDNLGNEEIPQTLTIKIAFPPTPTLTPVSSSNTSGESKPTPEVSTTTSTPVIARNEVTRQSSNSISSLPDVLGITFENPNHISDQINTSNILGKQKTKPTQTLGGLLIISGGIVTLAFLGLLSTFTFLKPSPE